MLLILSGHEARHSVIPIHTIHFRTVLLLVLRLRMVSTIVAPDIYMGHPIYIYALWLIIVEMYIPVALDITITLPVEIITHGILILSASTRTVTSTHCTCIHRYTCMPLDSGRHGSGLLCTYQCQAPATPPPPTGGSRGFGRALEQMNFIKHCILILFIFSQSKPQQSPYQMPLLPQWGVVGPDIDRCIIWELVQWHSRGIGVAQWGFYLGLEIFWSGIHVCSSNNVGLHRTPSVLWWHVTLWHILVKEQLTHVGNDSYNYHSTQSLCTISSLSLAPKQIMPNWLGHTL